ncbi:unnamed protein product [Clonostachys chloroleuca]|uniref:Uncharacterized protein n=1 Tax=Clonostachys chloroleuca TaxID=1926264 RepID=A0AA35QCG0_9HYPO|nr:unnamed protein product [Clonostachys chloroleuca]
MAKDGTFPADEHLFKMGFGAKIGIRHHEPFRRRENQLSERIFPLRVEKSELLRIQLPGITFTKASLPTISITWTRERDGLAQISLIKTHFKIAKSEKSKETDLSNCSSA